MSANSYGSSLIVQQVDGAALTNSTVATSLLPGAAKFTMPANIWQVGQKFQINASGIISTLAGSPGTLTLSFLQDAIAAWTSSTIPLNVTAQSNASWRLQVDLTVRSIASGTGTVLIGSGQFSSRAILGVAAIGAGPSGIVNCPENSPSTGAGFDCSSSHVCDLYGQWSVANASNSILCNQYELILQN
jgi:hypothetical protein